MRQKTFIPIVIFLISLQGFSQSLQKEVQHPDIATKLFHNPVRKAGHPVGSPYAQQAFAKANVVKINTEAFMRYNAFADEFEFINSKNDTLILDKVEDFSDIDFTGIQKKYRLLPYTDNRNKLSYGYLLLAYEKNGISLLKRENINFTEEKIARTTLEINMPARYSKGADSWFIRVKDNTATDFPDGKKALIKMFPDKKAAIESFIKENKIDFDDDAGKIRIIDFLAAQ